MDLTPPPMRPREFRTCPVAACGRQALAAQLRDPHTVPGTLKPCASVIITRRRFMPDDVHDGEISTDYEPDEVHALTTIEGEDFVSQAVTLLASEGLTEFSSWPEFQTNGWYSNPDGSPIVDNYTGEREEASAHLYGFTEDEKYQVWMRVTRK